MPLTRLPSALMASSFSLLMTPRVRHMFAMSLKSSLNCMGVTALFVTACAEIDPVFEHSKHNTGQLAAVMKREPMPPLGNHASLVYLVRLWCALRPRPVTHQGDQARLGMCVSCGLSIWPRWVILGREPVSLHASSTRARGLPVSSPFTSSSGQTPCSSFLCPPTCLRDTFRHPTCERQAPPFHYLPQPADGEWQNLRCCSPTCARAARWETRWG